MSGRITFFKLQIGISRALSALAPVKLDLKEMMNVPKIGRNPGHDHCIEEIRNVRRKMKRKYKFDFVCFLRLESNITTNGIRMRKVHPDDHHARAKKGRLPFQFKVATCRNAKLRAHFRTIIMDLRKNKPLQYDHQDSINVKSFLPIAIAY